MKKTFLAVGLLALAFTAESVNAQAGDGWLSRYWDGCKPSCSWGGKQYNGQGQCKECDKSNNKMNTSDMNKSSCDGGNSYTCWDMSPWAVDNTTAYGFAAAHRDQQCGTCWQLTFKGTTEHQGNGDASVLRGKKLTVMISNIGGDVAGNQLDFLVPGGGVGAFDSFSGQIGVSGSALGERYGGLVSAGCQGKPDCLKTKCDQVFGGSGKDWLKAGCYFYADWMGAIGNPQYNAVSVACPAELVDRWKNAATGSPPGSGNVNPITPNTFTLTATANPAAGGTVTRNPNAASYNPGTPVTVTAQANSDYAFAGWSGASTSANASVTVTMNSNLTLTANFTPKSGGNPSPVCNESLPENQRLVLTVNIDPAGSGSVTRTPSGCYSQDQKVTAAAVPNSGYNFVEWAGEGVTNAQSSSIELQMWWHRTVTAKFKTNGLSVINADAAKARGGIALKSARGGFTALLPAKHGYTSYKLINVQGREIKSGKIGANANGLSVNGLTRGVFFLRLEGKDNTPAPSLKVVTY